LCPSKSDVVYLYSWTWLCIYNTGIYKCVYLWILCALKWAFLTSHILIITMHVTLHSTCMRSPNIYYILASEKCRIRSFHPVREWFIICRSQIRGLYIRYIYIVASHIHHTRIYEWVKPIIMCGSGGKMYAAYYYILQRTCISPHKHAWHIYAGAREVDNICR
jgi:hypothetical protein